MTAQVLAPLAIDQFVEEFLFLEIQPTRVLVVEIVGVIPGRVVDLFLEARELLAGFFELAVHHFQHARDGAETVGVAILEVGSYGGQAFRIVDADGEFLILIVHRALVHMAERQEAEHFVAVVFGLADGVAVRVEHHIAVREHNALRQAGRTRSIDDAGAFVGADGFLVLFHNGSKTLLILPSEFIKFRQRHDLVVVIHHQELDVAVDFSGDRRNFLIQRRRADHDELHVGMGEDMQIVVLAERAVNRNMDHVGEVDAHIHEVPLRPVVGDGDDLCTRLVTQGQQAVCDRVCDFIILVNTVLDPFSAGTAGQDVLFGRIRLQVLEQVECAKDFHDK